MEKLEEELPDIEGEKLKNLKDVIEGKAEGRNIAYVSYKGENRHLYNGRIEKLTKKRIKYVVAYWGEQECYDDAKD